MAGTRRSLAASLVLVTILAGCSSEEPLPETSDLPVDPDIDPNLIEGERDLRTELLATDRLPAPAWRPGDWFVYTFKFSNPDVFLPEARGPNGLQARVVVVDDTGSAWRLASENEGLAKVDAIFDLPFLGELQKANLAGQGFGGLWDLFEFPLTDGSTWTRSFPYPSFDKTFRAPPTPIDLQFAAKFDPRIETGDGSFPGFVVVGTSADAKKIVEFDYVPQIGWFSRFVLYKLDSPDADADLFRAVNAGSGRNWTGAYYDVVATPRLQHVDALGFRLEGDPTSNPPEPWVEPKPVDTFTVGSEAETLVGFLHAFAYGGVRDLVLVDPQGGVREFRIIGAAFGDVVQTFDEAAKPGEWKLATVGTAAVTWALVSFWEVRATTAYLGNAGVA